jgi:hypothetical protein
MGKIVFENAGNPENLENTLINKGHVSRERFCGIIHNSFIRSFPFIRSFVRSFVRSSIHPSVRIPNGEEKY